MGVILVFELCIDVVGIGLEVDCLEDVCPDGLVSAVNVDPGLNSVDIVELYSNEVPEEPVNVDP